MSIESRLAALERLAWPAGDDGGLPDPEFCAWLPCEDPPELPDGGVSAATLAMREELLAMDCDVPACE